MEPRRYSMSDVRWFADTLCKHCDGVGPEQAAGIAKLVETLAFFERMSDADIEAWIKANWHSGE